MRIECSGFRICKTLIADRYAALLPATSPSKQIIGLLQYLHAFSICGLVKAVPKGATVFSKPF